MRSLSFHRKFEKRFVNLSPAQKKRVKSTLFDYASGKRVAAMRVHALVGEYEGQVSLSAGGDLRIHIIDNGVDSTIAVVAVGTHSQLYG